MATLPTTTIGSKRVEFEHVLLIVFLKNGIRHRREGCGGQRKGFRFG